MQKPSFFHDALQMYNNHGAIVKLLILWLNVLATGEIELTTGEKMNLLSPLCSYKKTPDLNYFSRHYLQFQDSFQVWKIKTFPRIYDSVWALFFLQYMYSYFQWFLNVLKAEWPLEKYFTTFFDWIKATWCFYHSLIIFPNIGKDQSHLKSL